VTLDQMLHITRPLIGIDVETTGTNTATARICEIALEIFRPGEPVKVWRSLVNPGLPIPPAATSIHHITDEMVSSAPTFADVAPNLLGGLQQCDFVGYHVRFDLQMLAESFRRAGLSWAYDDARILDGHRLWSLAEGRTLAQAVSRWTPDDTALEAHAAVADIQASTRVVAAQLRDHAPFPCDLDALHALQWPDMYDVDGKLRWNADGALCFGFGAHRDMPIGQAPIGYLTWVTKNDFSDKVKHACRDVLRTGQTPIRTP
jgi:DNA polymerase-3 subunit epsilon